MKASHTITPVFDDPNLVGSAGLVPLLRLAESAGLHDLVAEHLSVATPNAVAKTGAVVAGMLAGADSIDDLDVLRHGAMPRLFTGIRAPSTLDTFLRSFSHGHVQQLDAAGTRLLAGLTSRVPGLLAGGEAFARLDVDDTIREVHGHAKQGAAFGYSGVRGLNAQLAVVSTPTAAPVIAAARLRAGNTASGRGGGRLLAQAIKTARRAGVSGRVLVRADSAYYQHAFIGAALRAGAWFSVTARMNAQVVAAIGRIPEHAWKPIRYPQAVWEEAEQRWISDAEVAEIDLTVFTSHRKADHVACRLVVRRVKRLQPHGQGELFAGYRHHGFVTNSTLDTITADLEHRGHAVIEQIIAELKDGPLAHLPSGKYTANAAWLSHPVIAFNLARTAGVLASHRHARARWATLRTQLINTPGRVASSARRLTCTCPPTGPGPNPGRRSSTPPPHHQPRPPDHPAPPGRPRKPTMEEPGRPADRPCPSSPRPRSSAQSRSRNQRRWIRVQRGGEVAIVRAHLSGRIERVTPPLRAEQGSLPYVLIARQ